MNKRLVYLATLVALIFCNLGRAQIQLVPYYSFSESTGFYTPITSGTVLGSGTGLNSQNYLISLPFTVNFNGTNHTSVYVSVNGHLAFGASTGSNYWIIASSSTGFSAIAGFSADLASLNSTTELRYETTGSSPNRTFIVQWKNFGYPSTTALKTNFQIRIAEFTNEVKIIYDTVTVTGSSNLSVQAGLRGNTNAVFEHRGGSWSSSSFGSSNTDNFATTSTNLPPVGKTFTFTPPTCTTPSAQPSSLTLTPNYTSVSGSFTHPSPRADKYLVVRTANVTLNTTPTNGTYYSSGNTLGNGTVVYSGTGSSFSSSGLTQNTAYRFTVFAFNDTCHNGPLYRTTSPLSDTVVTRGPKSYIWKATTGSGDWQVDTNWIPTRTYKDVNDTLVFSAGGTVTVTNIATETITGLRVSGSTNVSFQNAGKDSLLLDEFLIIDANSTLNMPATSADTLILKFVAGADTAKINGTLNLRGNSVYRGRYIYTLVNGIFDISDKGTYDAVSATSRINGTLKMKNKSLLQSGGSTTTSVYGVLTMSDTATYNAANATVNIYGQVYLGGSAYYNATSGSTLIYGTVNDTGSNATFSSTCNCYTQITFKAGGVYNHARNGGIVPRGTYDTASIVNITGVTTTMPAFSSNSLGSLTWNCPMQTANMTNAALVSILKDFTLFNTGTGSVGLSDIDVYGNFRQVNGTYHHHNFTLAVYGNITLDSGVLIIGETSGSPYVHAKSNFVQGVSHHITVPPAAWSPSTLIFSGSISQNVILGGTTDTNKLISFWINNPQGIVLTDTMVVGAQLRVIAGHITGTGIVRYYLNGALAWYTQYSDTINAVEWPTTYGPRILEIDMEGAEPNNRLWMPGTRTLDIQYHNLGGILVLGNNDLIISNKGTGNIYNQYPDKRAMIAITGTGRLKLRVDTTQSVIKTYRFPVGDINGGVAHSGQFSITFKSNSVERYLTVGAKSQKHPQNTSSTNYLNMYWDFADDGGTNPYTYNLYMRHEAMDVVGTPNFRINLRHNNAWHQMNSWSANTSLVMIDTISSTLYPLGGNAITALETINNTYYWTGNTNTDYQNPQNWSPNRNVVSTSDRLIFNNGITDTVTNTPDETISSLKVTNNTKLVFKQVSYNAGLVLHSDYDTTTPELSVDSGSTAIIYSTPGRLSLRFMGTGSTARISGRIELVNGTVNSNASLIFDACKATVTTSGVLAAGGPVNDEMIESIASELIVFGKYEHKYTSTEGPIPLATWEDGSHVYILGYTNPVYGPDNSHNQEFYDFTYNCPAQTSNNRGGVPLRVRGTMHIISTGTGKWEFTNSSFQYQINKYKQTGGKIDINSGTQVSGAVMTITDTLLQTGGVMMATRSHSNANGPYIVFAGVSAEQFVSFADSAPAGPIIYEVKNPLGIKLAGTGYFSTSPIFKINTKGGIIIKAFKTNPINTTLTVQYDTVNTTLTFDTDVIDGNIHYTTDDVLFPASSGPVNLLIEAPVRYITLHSSRTIPGNLKLGGDIYAGTNNITLGKSATSIGTMSGSGFIRVTTGTFTRWFGTSSLPTSATDNKGRFPLSYYSSNRQAYVYFNGSTALSTAGTITMKHHHALGLTTGLSVADGSYSINKRTNAAWIFSTGNGIVASGSVGVRIYSNDLYSTTNPANLRVMKSSSVTGNHVSGGGTAPDYYAQRSVMSLSNFTTDSLYIGSDAANMDDIFISIQNGRWNVPSTWNKNAIPGNTDIVVIANDDSVTVDTTCVAKLVMVANSTVLHITDSSLTVDSTIVNHGNIIVNGGDITLGPNGGGNRRFASYNTLNIADGVLTVNGHIHLNAGSVLKQSGGTIKVDGNSGTLSTSVPSSTALFYSATSLMNVTGGSLIITDPHLDGKDAMGYNIPSGTCTFSANHTTYFGDGISTHSGKSSYGFQVSTTGSNVTLGSVVLNGSSSGNFRYVRQDGGVAIGGNLTINNNAEWAQNLSTTSGAYFTLYLGGNLVVNSGGTFTQNGTLTFGNISLPAMVSQTVSGTGVFRNAVTSSDGNFTNIVVNNSSNAGVKFNIGDFSFEKITFQKGNLNSGSNIAKALNNTAITGASQTTGWLRGILQIPIATGTAINQLFAVGDSLYYSPVTISGSASAITSAGALIISSNSGDHANISGSPILASKSVNRHYNIDTTGGINMLANSLSAAFRWNNADRDNGVDTTRLVAAMYKSSWVPLYTTSSSGTSLTVINLGNNLSGSYQIGEPGTKPFVTLHPVSDTICQNGNAIFTTSVISSAPNHKWQLNTGSGWNNISNGGVYSGADTNTLNITGASLSMNNYQYRCRIHNGSDTVYTDAVVLTINTLVTPALTITPSPNDTICSGAQVMFTAIPVNGGNTPQYQWKLNGSNVGTDSTYTINMPANNDIVSCIVTSNAECLSVATASAADTIVFSSPVTPEVTISVSPNDTICSGTAVTFTAIPINGGASPIYQWKLNGTNVGTNSSTYNNSNLSNNDVVTCLMTSNAGCVTKTIDTSNTITMTVITTLTPVVTIAVTPNDTICAGTSVTFTATPTDGGTSPSFQWKLNGSNVGTNSTTYSSSNIANNDIVTCLMTINATCATKTIDTSNSIAMTVNSIVTPEVTITVSPNDTVCAGTIVTFTATPVNGGTNPSYQWKLNGSNIGSNSPVYTNYSITDNDVITCIMTSSLSCTTKTMDTSNAITMEVIMVLTPNVYINVNQGNNVCAGTSVTFNAVVSNGGSSQVVQWQLNGSNVGTNSVTYVNSTLNNGDVVRCYLVSSHPCVTKTTDTSNSITMTVNPALTPDVTITVSPNDTICAGTMVTFTANPTNGGSTPAYQWKLNGTNVGGNSTTYNTNALSNSDVVTCIMTSNATCLSKTTDTSNSMTITVNPILIPSLAISVSPNDTVCVGSSVTFTAIPTNGGSSPGYQWKNNSVNITGATNSTYNTTTLANGDVISCELTSTAICANPASATSNGISMTVNPLLTPTIAVSTNPGTTICANTPVTFTATITNGGSTPAYQWKLNGGNVGTNSSSYVNASLSNGDIISCQLTSSAACVTNAIITSTNITMAVNPLLTPSVTVNASPGLTVGPWAPITFTANPTNGGAAPTYQWKKNGTNIPGATANTYLGTTNAELADGDVICVAIKSNALCPSPDTATGCASAIKVNLGATDLINIKDLQLYPNPNEGVFTVKGTLLTNEPVMIEILNVMGQIVYSATTQPQNRVIETKITITGMVQGNYILRLKVDNMVENIRLTIR